MGTVGLATRIEAPARVAWNHISWEGMKCLAGGRLIQRVEFAEPRNRVGSLKTYYVPGRLPVVVKLLEIDDEEMMYRYRIVDDGDALPGTDYVGYLRITPCGPQACHLKIENSFTAIGVTEEEYKRVWTEMEWINVNDVKRIVEKPRSTQHGRCDVAGAVPASTAGWPP
jgi:hypothetical protein